MEVTFIFVTLSHYLPSTAFVTIWNLGDDLSPHERRLVSEKHALVIFLNIDEGVLPKYWLFFSLHFIAMGYGMTRSRPKIQTAWETSDSLPPEDELQHHDKSDCTMLGEGRLVKTPEKVISDP